MFSRLPRLYIKQIMTFRAVITVLLCFAVTILLRLTGFSDNDLNYTPIQKDLRNFIDNGEEFDKEETEDFIDRFSER
jgi:hypothetical protein